MWDDRAMWCLHRNSRISLIILALLGGCGGGGDDSNPPPVNNRPVAEINASVTQGPAPLGVSFDGSQSSDPDGRIISYRWDFGDGSPPSSGQQVFHEYPDPGGYNVRLTVTDDDSATGTRTVNIQVQGASLSGSVNILSSSAVDADVNDRLTTPTANNDFATAQPIPNPVRLGGFVNLPGTGPSTGNLFSSGDTADFYAVSASGNEIVLLNIADPEANLELRLWDSQQNMVDATAGTGSTKSLTIDNPGSYFIEVFPASGASNPPGASNYVLSVGQDLSVAARPPNRVSDPFVPGELLLAAPVDRTAALQTGYDLRIQGRSGRFARARLGGRSRARILSRLGNGRGGDYGELPRHGRLTAALRARYETLLNVRDLSRDPELSQVEPNLMLRPSLEPDDEFYPLQWHYRAIKAPFAWDLTTGNENPVTIAVIDTGILPGHPDLGCQLLSGYDFIADPFRARDGDGIDPDPSDAGDLAFGSASSFHGTHVAGTVAACSNNGIGVAGVSWGARLMPLRALGVDGGTSYDVSQAIRYAAGLPSDAGAPPPPADIINLSLGSPFTSSLLADAVAAARAAGVILVASAGNQASSNPIYPAAYEGVISVAATTIENRLAPYSNFGAVDLAAPGGYNATDFNGDGFADGVVSLLGDDSSGGPLRLGYAALNGTSMAAPHVTGVIALMKSVHPGLSPAAFDLALAAGALTDDLGEPGRDPNYGHGLINAQKAVLEALAMASGGGTDP
jgi:serine protease